MTILYLLVAASLAVGVLNFLAVVLLSNAMFRFVSLERQAPEPMPSRESGLLDLEATATYDPRFRR